MQVAFNILVKIAVFIYVLNRILPRIRYMIWYGKIKKRVPLKVCPKTSGFPSV